MAHRPTWAVSLTYLFLFGARNEKSMSKVIAMKILSGILLSAALYVGLLASCGAADKPSSSKYWMDIKATKEDVNPDTAKRVADKIRNRPRLSRADQFAGTTQFGLHGVETPFLRADMDTASVEEIYNLMSRAGVDSLRSAQTTWNLIADKQGEPRNYKEVDFQVQNAKKYGMSNLFIFGYPPPQFSVGHNKLSAVKSEYYPKYKTYMRNTLDHIKNGNVSYLELGNEVDAPSVWWKDSTPQMYVDETKLLKSALSEQGLDYKIAVFSATFSRDGDKGPDAGRGFVEKSFKLGISQYADAYSLHHFSFEGKDRLPEYMRSVMRKNGASGKPLLNTEQLDTIKKNGANDSRPYNLVKLFARNFYFYKMPRMDYFLARDIYQNGKLYPYGLFDMDWKPKLRLLAYAMAVDAMKGKKLVKITEPAPGVEAYILENQAKLQDSYKYTVLAWRNDESNKAGTVLKGLSGQGEIEDWQLNLKKVDLDRSQVAAKYEPIAIYTNTLPDWRPVTSLSYLNAASKDKKRGAWAPMPTD